MMDKLFKNLATYGFIGYLPAPGTMATLATLPLVYLLSMAPPIVYFAVIGIGYLLSIIVVKHALPFFSEVDPSAIVIDEGIGTLITFSLVPISPLSMILGFGLFRFFDISKIGLSRFERIVGPAGVMLDDVVAGFISCLILHGMLRVL